MTYRFFSTVCLWFVFNFAVTGHARESRLLAADWRFSLTLAPDENKIAANALAQGRAVTDNCSWTLK